MKFWAYKHINGTIHVKICRGNFWQDAIDDAFASPFVEDVVVPFEAETRDKAEEVAKEILLNE